MQFLNEAETSRLVTEEVALGAAREAFTAAGRTFPVVIGYGAREGERFTLKSGSTAGSVGVKIGSYWPGNEELGLTRHGSSVILLDPRTGRISAVVEAAAANAYRTAAADALAVQTLARPDASTLAVLGTGNQAFYEAAAVVRVRPIETVLVAGRNPERAADLARRLAEKLGIAVRVVPVRDAVENADVISTATTSTSALMEADWVRPGTHISAMGADGSGKQELPVELYSSEHTRLFCDIEEQSRTIGEFRLVPASTTVTPLGDVLRGTAPGRGTDQEVTVFDSSGFALQDLSLARALLAAAGQGSPDTAGQQARA
nr:ornithine cyclodeaminase family protein [Actinomycetales bacterium]